jgi:hypothetical protein
MKKFQYQTHIDATTDKVFTTISDASQFCEAVPHIVNVEMMSDQKTGLGTRFRETRIMNGREEATELEVTGFEEVRYGTQSSR